MLRGGWAWSAAHERLRRFRSLDRFKVRVEKATDLIPPSEQR